jgi:hypothetical protein
MSTLNSSFSSVNAIALHCTIGITLLTAALAAPARALLRLN